MEQYIRDRVTATQLLNQRQLNREEREELSNLQQILASAPPLVKLTNIKPINLPKVNKVRAMGGFYRKKLKSRRSIKKLKSKKVKRDKRKTIKRVKKGGHLGENLRHYHLNVKTPQNKSIELSELFAESGKAKQGINEIDVTSATIGDLKTAIIDKEKGYSWNSTLNKLQPSWIMDPDNSDKTKPITLFFQGKALLDDNMKLRDLFWKREELLKDDEMNSRKFYERLPLYTPNNDVPIIIKLDGTFDRSSIVETERVKNKDFEDTP